MRLSENPLIDAAAIQARVASLAQELARDYAGREPILVGVLKGALHFTSDLARQMGCPVEIEFVRASSYQGNTSSGQVQLEAKLQQLSGRDVIVVEDILDTGCTLAAITAYIHGLGPNSLRICTLLDKPIRRKECILPDYTGFVIDDHFVVGYGLDYNERHRELAAIHVMEE